MVCIDPAMCTSVCLVDDSSGICTCRLGEEYGCGCVCVWVSGGLEG